MRELLLLLSVVSAFGGAMLIFLAPPGDVFLGRAGAVLCCTGALMAGAAHYLAQDMPRRRNFARVAVFYASLAAAFAGFTVIMYYLGNQELPGSALFSAAGYAGLAAGALGMLYGYRYHINTSLLEIAGELGFVPADSGLTRPDGPYDIKGVVGGVEMALDGSDKYGTREVPHRISLYVKCRVANSGGAWVAAYPGSLGNRPLSALPPRVEGVPYWDWHTVCSAPPDAAERFISESRRLPTTVFAEEYGFMFLELKGGELHCSFEREGVFSVGYVRAIVEQAARMAADIK